MTPARCSAQDAAAGVALLALQSRRGLVAGPVSDDHVGADSSVNAAGPSQVVPEAKPIVASLEAKPVINIWPEAQPAIAIPEALAIAMPEAPNSLTANLTAFGDHVGSSYSLSSAGQGGALSGTADRDANNVSILPPITQERFEPFGYPGAGLLLELHLPSVTLRELHSSSKGSLAQFLLDVRGELCKGASVKEPRISILGIHGRYKRYDTAGLFTSSRSLVSDRTSQSSGPEHLNEEVVVRFEILPGWENDVDPRKALTVLKEQLSSSQSGIWQGPLSTVLVNSSITLGTAFSTSSQHARVEHRGMAHMSAMAWPIGISAAFIGILIWLAAY